MQRSQHGGLIEFEMIPTAVDRDRKSVQVRLSKADLARASELQIDVQALFRLSLRRAILEMERRKK